MPPDKNAVQWFPDVGQGVINLGVCFLVDNSGNFLLDQSGNFLTTTNYIVSQPNVTSWSETPAS